MSILEDQTETTLTDKYRPTEISDVVGQPEVQRKVKPSDKPVPFHMIFAGPPGNGKTSTARALAREHFGEDWEDHFHEFNASDERGIDFVRLSIKKLFNMSYPKIIFLDEADKMTKDAQEAMRTMMEPKKGRPRLTCLILSCNKPWLINEAIASRCLNIQFYPIKDEIILDRLVYILESEGVEYDLGSGDEFGKTPDAELLERIITIHKGDLRGAIQELEMVIEGDKLNPELLPESASPDFLKDALEHSLQGDFEKAQRHLEDAIVISTLSPEVVVDRTREYVSELDDLFMRCELLNKLGETRHRLNYGSHMVHYNAFLAFAWLLSQTSKTQTMNGD